MTVMLMPVAGLVTWAATVVLVEVGIPAIRRRREARRADEEREQSRLSALEDLRERARALGGEPPRSYRVRRA